MVNPGMTQSIILMHKIAVILFKTIRFIISSNATYKIFHLLYTSIQFPQRPTDTPIYTAGKTETEKDNAKLQWHAWRMEHANIKTMSHLLTNLFLNCIEDTYKDHIMSSMVGHPNKTVIEIFEYFMKYGKVTSVNIENNRVDMKKMGFNNPTDIFIKQINDTSECSKYTDPQIS